MKRYVIGVDYGTLSGRAVLCDVESGQVLASAVYDYPHAVMDRALPDGTPLGADWALQHPQDYLDVLLHTIPEVLRLSGVKKEQVIAIGTDFTASTALPCKADGTPLCFLDAYAANPHAYVKLWKHHAAQHQANEMTRIAQARGEAWLGQYGNRISSEWSIPKLWQILQEAPDIYAAMDHWVEAGDWVVWQLCGCYAQNACAAGYKSFFRLHGGYPDESYFAALDEKLRHVIAEKLSAPVAPVATRAGGLTPHMADRLGLMPGTTVAVGHVDAHACVPAAGITQAGQALAIIGTSTCLMLMDEQLCAVPGVCGAVEDGILPGFWGYEAGQSCVGDMLAWMTKNAVPETYQQEAARQGLSIHQYLTELASRLAPGQSGLLALDWFNGNRSILTDADLTGLILGLTLQTTPEEIYRALIESTAYGLRTILDNYRAHGVAIRELYAAGGISQKNPLAMQIYADVLNMPVRVVDSAQGGALGSAIMAAAAAGAHESITQAIQAMAAPVQRMYQPDPDSCRVYEALYQEYHRLHDYLGRGENNVMKRLKALRQGTKKAP